MHLTGRDIGALVWCGDMYGIRADLLASLLGTSGDVVRQLHARWRRAGLAETGRLGPPPVCRWPGLAGRRPGGWRAGVVAGPGVAAGAARAAGAVAARVVLAALAVVIAQVAAPGDPAVWALAVGAATWLARTGRLDLAPRARR